MVNKFVIGILVLLVFLTGGIGYYSFTLNRQVDSLSERISTFDTEQTARVKLVSDELAALGKNTESSLGSLGGQVAGAQIALNTLKTDLSNAQDLLKSTGEKVSGVTAQVYTLDKRVTGTESGLSGLSRSVINAGDIYQKTSQATVRITDGQNIAGSGFFYDTSGRVVTAYHVVKNLSPIYIMTYDGRTFKATTLGYCQFSDVAILNLEKNPSIAPLPLGDSGKIHIGDPVIAIGSPGDSDEPLGLRDTLTAGIISQVNRYENVSGLYFANLLQFDAAINFGNSGCPLIDSQGQVIGVVNARMDPTRGDGLSWAVASNKVKRVVTAIISTGSFAYPFIGTGLSDLTPQLVSERSLATANGALVGIVTTGGPALAAGLLTGDIITAMDGIPMRNVSDLTCYLGEFKSPGDTTVIEVIRGTNKLNISVVVGKRTQ